MLTPLTDDDPRQVGRYRLHNRIGAGGMGTVYLGFTPDSEPVAVKVAAAELAEDQEFRSRFEREVRAALRVRGGAVASVLDADTSAPQPWMVTEYVEGISLADAVRRRGRLEPHLVRGLAVGLADALVAIHAAGVVHRDLKPSNILLAWDGPKVIDFGIAQLTDSATLTRTGHVIGTLAWMAPEQMRGESAGTAADVFAWASCVTYAATGRHPFHAEAPDLLAQRVQRDEPDLDAVPLYLRGLVKQALSKAPRDRLGAADLLAALVGHEVRGVTEADAAAGNVLEQTWTGPSPAFGVPSSGPGRSAGSPVPVGPFPPVGHVPPGAPVQSGPSGRAARAGSVDPSRSPQGPGPTTPPPPASAFRATSGPGLTAGAARPPVPSRSQPAHPPVGAAGRIGHSGGSPPGGAGSGGGGFSAAGSGGAGSGGAGFGGGGVGGTPARPDPPPGQPSGGAGSAEATFRPSDPTPPVAPPDPRSWPVAQTPGHRPHGGSPVPGAQAASFPPARPAAPARPAPPFQVPSGYAPAPQAGHSEGRVGASPVRGTWNTCALLSLGLGVFWIFGFGSVAALVLGYVARLQIRRRRQRGSVAATVGIGLGWLGVITSAVLAIVVRAIV